MQRTFAEYFAAWGLFLPDEAIASRSAGYLLGKGWSVRWRWVDGDGDDATLEFLASHRMTNERWQRIAPDGALSKIDVPFEAMVFPPDAGDEQRAAIEHDYRAAWGTHIAAVEQAGMDPIQGRPRIPNEVAGPALMTWMIDGGDWQSAPLLARS
ncbi:MAG: hypothetical protein Q7T55_19235 [Solirubrobacteraceae bacterium]|nr:hypothetical protein [Solirubrobacteraceae bacterium]